MFILIYTGYGMQKTRRDTINGGVSPLLCYFGLFQWRQILKGFSNLNKNGVTRICLCKNTINFTVFISLAYSFSEVLDKELALANPRANTCKSFTTLF